MEGSKEDIRKLCETGIISEAEYRRIIDSIENNIIDDSNSNAYKAIQTVAENISHTAMKNQKKINKIIYISIVAVIIAVILIGVISRAIEENHINALHESLNGHTFICDEYSSGDVVFLYFNNGKLIRTTVTEDGEEEVDEYEYYKVAKTEDGLIVIYTGLSEWAIDIAIDDELAKYEYLVGYNYKYDTITKFTYFDGETKHTFILDDDRTPGQLIEEIEEEKALARAAEEAGEDDEASGHGTTVGGPK